MSLKTLLQSRMIRAAAALTLGLVVLSCFVHILLGGAFTDRYGIKPEWPIWLALAQVAGMAALLTRFGLPRGILQPAAFLSLNLVLLGVGWLSWQDALRETSLFLLDAAVRLLVAGAWFGLGVGLVAVSVRTAFRSRRDSGRAPAWIKPWFAATLFILTLEAGTRVAIDSEPERADLRFPTEWVESNDGRLRIAALGGSTTQGFPYNPRFGFPKVFTMQLEKEYPDREFILTNLGEGGANFRDAAQRLRLIEEKPDLILLYTGHNEFFYDLDTTVLRPRSPLPALDERLSWSAAYRLVSGGIPRLRRPRVVHIDPERVLREPLFNREVHRQRLHAFRDQLEQLARFCKREEIETVWFLPAAGEGTYEPNRPGIDGRLTPSLEARFQREFAKAETLEQGEQWSAAQAVYEALLQEFPTMAEASFRLGECQFKAGDDAAARRSFRRAIDHDGFPSQATTPYREVLREIAERYGIPILDAEEVLRPLTPHAILDRTVIHDNVHPTLRGFYALGMAAAELPEVRQWIARSAPPGLTNEGKSAAGSSAPLLEGSSNPDRPVLLFVEAIRACGMQAEDLAVAYERTAWCLEHLGKLRSDPSRRDREAAVYRRWAEQLRSGEIQPGEAGTESLSESSAGVRLRNPSRQSPPRTGNLR